ncbi:GATA transcription factor 11 [Fagus crenata]
MVGLDDNFNGISDDCFDDMFKFFDFPLEDVEGNVGGEDWSTKFLWLEPPPLDVLAGLPSGFPDKNSVDSSKFPESFSTQHVKTSPLKELPITAEANSSRSALLHKPSNGKDLRPFQTSSPVSVLESSSSYSVENLSSSCSVENPTTIDLKNIIPVKRARSKRPRPSNSNRQFMIPFIPSTSSAPKIAHPSAAFESGSETSDLTETVSNPWRKKMRKKKNLAVLSGATEKGNYYWQETVATRKCTHCEVTKTPQWREGPMGPKTLCNACGVRYRSGRLLPEYRPAASPTFVASLHSNSHKKVVEMRKKSSTGARMAGMETLLSPSRRVSIG